MDMALSDALGFSGLFGSSASKAATLYEVDDDRKLRLGMLFYVLSDAILALFFVGSYVFLRGYNTNDRWVPPPMVKTIGNGPVDASAAIMVIALAGALCYAVAQWGLYRDRDRLFTWMALAALLVYVADLVIGIVMMAHIGFAVTDGSFASAFLVLAGYHVYHMLIGAFLGIGVVVRAACGLYRTPAAANSPNAQVAAAQGGEAPNVVPPTRLSGIASIGYYWFYAALYSVAVWLLLVIQPPLR
jgi:heme/copper-type cytochrome/quinol oxidase subunit 3